MPWINFGTYSVLRQQQMQSCGYCCVGMVLNLIDMRQDSESSLVSTGMKVGGTGAYDRFTGDRVGVSQTPLVRAAHEEFNALPHFGSGTYGHHLAKVLQWYSIDATYHGGLSHSGLKAMMRAATPQTPMIVLVQWNAGGGHWVLVVDRKTRGLGRQSEYTILDPGGQVVRNLGSTEYRNNAAGRFAGYCVTVQGRQAQASYKQAGVKMPGM